jgi:L-asparaginase II
LTAPGRAERWPFRPWVGVERGGFLESVHEGLLVVVDDTGRERARWGDPTWTSFLRSSAKMIQALPVVESGAADAFRLEPRHLALCCASHSGETMHVEGVREILARSGVDEALLHCGPHPPVHADSAAEVVRRGETPARIHNNCSGKHAGMLAACAHRGWSLADYWKPYHPVQREIVSALARLADVDPASIDHAVDGCGVPAFRLPVVRFAHALARFAASDGAAARLFAAMTAHPEMVGGTGRFCTELPRAARRPLLAKAGAEGFYAVAWREDSGRGVALAAKSAAGDSRSRDFAVTEALGQMGVLDGDGVRKLAPFHSGPLRNHAGEPVGRLRSLMDLAPEAS